MVPISKRLRVSRHLEGSSGESVGLKGRKRSSSNKQKETLNDKTNTSSNGIDAALRSDGASLHGSRPGGKASGTRGEPNRNAGVESFRHGDHDGNRSGHR